MVGLPSRAFDGRRGTRTNRADARREGQPYLHATGVGQGRYCGGIRGLRQRAESLLEHRDLRSVEGDAFAPGKIDRRPVWAYRHALEKWENSLRRRLGRIRSATVRGDL